MKVFRSCGLKAAMIAAAMLLLGSTVAYAQTPGQIPMFDQAGTGFCNSAGGNDCIDSVITQDASGNVGIGTTSPDWPLHVQSNLTFGPIFQLDATNTAGGKKWFFQSSGGDAFQGQGKLIIRQHTDGLDTMTIDPNGNVGIGTTTPAQRLQVFGNIRVGDAGANGCVQHFGGGSLVGVCASDVRLKKDIKPFPKLLDRLVQLQPVSFFWRQEEFPGRGFGADKDVGLVAQEVEKVFPELVAEDDSGYKAVRYHQLPLLMLQALKDQQEQVRDLRAENLALKAQLAEMAELKVQLSKLQGMVEMLLAQGSEEPTSQAAEGHYGKIRVAKAGEGKKE